MSRKCIDHFTPVHSSCQISAVQHCSCLRCTTRCHYTAHVASVHSLCHHCTQLMSRQCTAYVTTVHSSCHVSAQLMPVRYTAFMTLTHIPGTFSTHAHFRDRANMIAMKLPRYNEIGNFKPARYSKATAGGQFFPKEQTQSKSRVLVAHRNALPSSARIIYAQS